MLDLVHRALLRRLVRAIPMDFGSVPETATGEMVVGHFDHDFRVDRFPFTGSFCAPAAWAAGSISSESWLLPERLEFFRQGGVLSRFKCRGKPDVIEPAIVVIYSEEQR